MSNTDPHLTIVVGVELDETGHAAWLRAADMAFANPDTQIHLCYCHGSEYGSSARAEKILSAGAALLDKWATERLFGHPLIARTETHVGLGRPSEVIRQLAVDVCADFIVVGTHHKNVFERLTEGSVVRELLSDAPCTIVIAQEKDYQGRELSVTIEAEHVIPPARRTLGRSRTYGYRHGPTPNLG